MTMTARTATRDQRGPRGPRADRVPHLDHGPRLDTELRPRERIDWRAAVGYQRRGSGDPTMVTEPGRIWRAVRTPVGVATIVLGATSDGIRASAWGPGREWAVDQLPALCGLDDDPAGFDPSAHPLLREVHHRRPDLRLGRTDLWFDALVQSIFEQKVTAIQAFAAWRRIVTWYGERAPGPTPKPMFAPPALDDWRLIPSWAWHRAGLEPPQSRTISLAAQRAHTLERVLRDAADVDERERVLISQRGIGPWTSAETRIRAGGDPDAVSVRDYHLAHQVGYALTGSRTDDAGMLTLLEPWAGHRQRVIRLIAASGVSEPRRAPRLHPEDHRNR